MEYNKRIVLARGILYFTHQSNVYAFEEKSGKLLNQYNDHIEEVRAIAIKGDRLMSVSKDSTLKFSNIKSGRSYFTATSHSAAIWWMQFYRRGKDYRGAKGQSFSKSSAAIGIDYYSIFTGSNDGTVREFDAQTGEELQVFSGHNGYINCMLTRDGKSLYTGSADGTAKKFEIATGKCLFTFEGHTGGIFSMDVGNSYKLYTGSEDMTIRVWHRREGTCESVYRGSHTATIDTLLFDLKTFSLYSGDRDGNVFKFNKAAEFKDTEGDRGRIPEFSFKGHTDDIKALEMHSTVDHEVLVTSSDDGTAKAWDTKTGKLVHDFVGHKDKVTSIIVKGDVLYTRSGDRTCRSWDLETGKLKTVYNARIAAFQHFELFGANRVLFARFNISKFFEAELSTGKILTTVDTDLPVRNIHYSKTDGRVYVGVGGLLAKENEDAQCPVYAYSTIGDKLILEDSFVGHRRAVVACKVGAGAKFLFSGSKDGTIRKWDLASKQCAAVYDEHEGGIECIDFDQLKRFLFSGSKDSTIKKWDTETDECVLTFTGCTATVYTLQVAGSQLFTAGHDNIARIWDANTGKLLKNLTGHRDWINSIRVIGPHVWTASKDESVHVHDRNSGRLIRVLEQHPTGVRSMQVGEDGTVYTAGTHIITYDSQLLRSQGVARHHKLWREDGLRFYIAEYGPPLDFTLALILLLVDILQLGSFAFFEVDAWQSSVVVEIMNYVRRFGIIWLASYELAMIISFSCIAALFLLFLTQETLEWYKFAKPKGIYNVLWLVYGLIAKLLTRPLFLPILAVMAESINCQKAIVGDDRLWLVPTLGSRQGNNGIVYDLNPPNEAPVECFAEPRHWIYMIVSAISLAFYVPVSIRMIRVGNELSAIEAHWNIFDWSEDRFIPTFTHRLAPSPRGPKFLTTVAVIKFILSFAAIIALVVADPVNYQGDSVPFAIRILYVIFLIGAIIILWASWAFPPFFSRRFNAVRFGLDIAVLWTYVNGYIAVTNSNSQQVIVWGIGVLPCLALGFAFRWYKPANIKLSTRAFNARVTGKDKDYVSPGATPVFDQPRGTTSTSNNDTSSSVVHASQADLQLTGDLEIDADGTIHSPRSDRDASQGESKSGGLVAGQDLGDAEDDNNDMV